MPRKNKSRAEQTREQLRNIKDPGVRAAVKAAGNGFRLARDLGLTPAAIYRWDRIPSERIKDVERVTGVRREKLRPDLY